MKKPISDDWIFINSDTEYSKSKQLYYYNGKVYDELSASHNGIIGNGYNLKKIIEDTNK